MHWRSAARKGARRVPVAAAEGGKKMTSRSCCGDSCCPGEAKAVYYPASALAMRPDVDGAACWAVGLGRAMLTRFAVKPGARFERHAHEAEQITMVLKGSLTFEFEGEPPVRLLAGEVVAIPSGLPHGATAGPEGADAVDAWSPPREEFVRAGSTADAGAACCDSSCCSPSPDSIRETVREGYSKIAEAGSWSAAQGEGAAKGGCCGTASRGSGGGCCGPGAFTPEDLATAVGYSRSELSALPEGANMGLSCGNPTALASLRPGEVVLDLGSGGGFDCFIAGPKVRGAGKVIGVDMTP